MTTPPITDYPGAIPNKGQSQSAFDTNVDDFLTWLSATNVPEYQALVTWTQDVADTVLATALAGDLPPLTGQGLNYLRVNAGETAAEFTTPAEVLLDIGSGTTGRAVFESETDAEAQVIMGLGTASTEDTGTTVGDVVQLVNVGGSPALPAVDGSLLAGIASIGVGQTWQDMSGSRALNTTYQNTTGKPISVVARLSSGAANVQFSASADNITFVTLSESSGVVSGRTTSAIIPNNHYYKTNTASGVIEFWSELR